MWFQVLAAVQIDHDALRFYTWEISSKDQLFYQSDFIYVWWGNRPTLLWLQKHCFRCQFYHYRWIVEREE